MDDHHLFLAFLALLFTLLFMYIFAKTSVFIVTLAASAFLVLVYIIAFGFANSGSLISKSRHCIRSVWEALASLSRNISSFWPTSSHYDCISKEELQQYLKKASEEVSEKTISEHKKASDLHQTHIQEKEQEIKDLDVENKTLSKIVSEQNKNLVIDGNKDTEIIKLQAETRSLKNQLYKSNTLSEKRESAIRPMEGKINMLENKLSEIRESNLRTMNGKIKVLEIKSKDDLDEANSKHKQSSELLKIRNARIEELEKTVTDHEHDSQLLKARERRIKELEETLTKHENDYQNQIAQERIIKELEEIKTKYEVASNVIKAGNVRIEELKAESKKLRDTKNAEIEELKNSQLMSIKQATSDIATSYNDSETKLTTTQNALKTITKDLESNKSKVQSTQVKLDNALEQLKTTEDALTTAQKERSEALQKSQSLEKDKDRHLEDLNTINQLRVENARVQDDLTRHKATQEERENRAQTLFNDAKTQAETEFTKLQNLFNDSMSSSNDYLNRINNHVCDRTAINTAEAKLKAAAANFGFALVSRFDVTSEFIIKVRALHIQGAAKQGTIDDLNVKMETITKELEDAISKRKDLDDIATRLAVLFDFPNEGITDPAIQYFKHLGKTLLQQRDKIGKFEAMEKERKERKSRLSVIIPAVDVTREPDYVGNKVDHALEASLNHFSKKSMNQDLEPGVGINLVPVGVAPPRLRVATPSATSLTATPRVSTSSPQKNTPKPKTLFTVFGIQPGARAPRKKYAGMGAPPPRKPQFVKSPELIEKERRQAEEKREKEERHEMGMGNDDDEETTGNDGGKGGSAGFDASDVEKYGNMMT